MKLNQVYPNTLKEAPLPAVPLNGSEHVREGGTSLTPVGSSSNFSFFALASCRQQYQPRLHNWAGNVREFGRSESGTVCLFERQAVRRTCHAIIAVLLVSLHSFAQRRAWVRRLSIGQCSVTMLPLADWIAKCYCSTLLGLGPTFRRTSPLPRAWQRRSTGRHRPVCSGGFRERLTRARWVSLTLALALRKILHSALCP